MRLKGQKVQGALMSNRNSSTNLDENNNGDLLNGSSASCSSASAIGAHDDLDNAVDSADDEIDVGTNADSIEFNANSANTSAALSGINNDHQFGIFNSQSLNYSSSLNSNQQMSQSSCNSMTEADRKRAHHNALERKRRDHIKDSFHTLRDAIPNIKGEKTSRAQILKAATDYIRLMRNRNVDYQNDIDSLKKQNNDIESQIKQLEKAKQVASQYLKQQQMGDQTANMNLSDDLDDVKDYKFDLVDVKPTIVQTAPIVSSTTLTTNALTTHHVLTKTSPNTTTTTTTGTANSNTNTTNTTNPTNGSNSLLILNKTITPTITTLSASAAANSKKFKTIINTKNNINIINLNNPSASAATTIKTLNSSSLGANSTSSSANSSSLANNDFL